MITYRFVGMYMNNIGQIKGKNNIEQGIVSLIIASMLAIIEPFICIQNIIKHMTFKSQ